MLLPLPGSPAPKPSPLLSDLEPASPPLPGTQTPRLATPVSRSNSESTAREALGGVAVGRSSEAAARQLDGAVGRSGGAATGQQRDGWAERQRDGLAGRPGGGRWGPASGEGHRRPARASRRAATGGRRALGASRRWALEKATGWMAGFDDLTFKTCGFDSLIFYHIIIDLCGPTCYFHKCQCNKKPLILIIKTSNIS